MLSIRAMGLFDDLKMATGMGLEPTEAYRRAFEKGVLLGVDRFDEASDMFKTAAEKLQATDAAMARRATANSWIYGFLSTRDPRAAGEAARLLRDLAEIEVPGTADEVMSGPNLAKELEARMFEAQAQAAHGREAAALFRHAANAWLGMRRERPVTFTLTGDDENADDGMTRFFYNAALAEVREADSWAHENPDEAAVRYAVAALAFGRCGATQLRQDARERLRCIGLERSCWFCGRHVRGLGTNLRLLPSIASDYFHRLDRSEDGRNSSYDPSGAVFACAACAAAIDNVAAERADAVRRELGAHVQQLQTELGRLESRLRSVESKSHSHVGV